MERRCFSRENILTDLASLSKAPVLENALFSISPQNQGELSGTGGESLSPSAALPFLDLQAG